MRWGRRSKSILMFYCYYYFLFKTFEKKLLPRLISSSSPTPNLPHLIYCTLETFLCALNFGIWTPQIDAIAFKSYPFVQTWKLWEGITCAPMYAKHDGKWLIWEMDSPFGVVAESRVTTSTPLRTMHHKHFSVLPPISKPTFPPTTPTLLSDLCNPSIFQFHSTLDEC